MAVEAETGKARLPEVGGRFIVDRGDDYGQIVEVVGYGERGLVVCADVIPERLSGPCRWINPGHVHEYLKAVA